MGPHFELTGYVTDDNCFGVRLLSDRFDLRTGCRLGALVWEFDDERFAVMILPPPEVGKADYEVAGKLIEARSTQVIGFSGGDVFELAAEFIRDHCYGADDLADELMETFRSTLDGILEDSLDSTTN